MSTYNLQRFHKAQENNYPNALLEIRSGRKTSHWMWFIFPQLAGLGYSETAKFYAVRNLEEAELYLQDNILAERLITICKALLQLKGKTANDIFGSPDDLKLKSSMTLFSAVQGAGPVFQQVLDYYFEGKKDKKTLRMLGLA